jgi:hypothetical protein
VPTRRLRKAKQSWLTSCPRCGALVVFEVWLVQAPRVMRYLADPPAKLVTERLVHVPCTECVATVEIFLGPCMDSLALGDEAAYTRYERRAMNPTFDGDVPWSHAITADGTEWWVLLECGHGYVVRQASRPIRPEGAERRFVCSECERMEACNEATID